MMTACERLKKFEEDFARLKSNRAKVPLDQLKTRYAKAYNSLVSSIEEYAEWFADEYIRTLAIQTSPEDEAGNAWLQEKVADILADERKPGGLYHLGRDALIVNLDQKEFEYRVWEIHDRLKRDAYDPYHQRFNKWVGTPENRRIYNSLFDAYWKPTDDPEDGGYWIDEDGNWKGYGYPPRLEPDPQGSEAAT